MAGLPNNNSLAVECSKLQTSPVCPEGVLGFALAPDFVDYWNFNLWNYELSHFEWEALMYVSKTWWKEDLKH